MLADVGALADDAAEVRHAQRDEADRAADAHRRGHQEHDHRQAHGLAPGGQLDLPVEMPRQVAVRADGERQAHAEQHQREEDVARGDALQVEVGGAPEVVLLEQVAGGGVGDHDGAERADEGAEDDAEGDQVLRGDPQGHEEADEGADERADEGSDGQRAPAGHRGGRGAQARGTAQPEGIDVPELVAPKVLHLDASDGQGDARQEDVQQAQQHMSRT